MNACKNYVKQSGKRYDSWTVLKIDTIKTKNVYYKDMKSQTILQFGQENPYRLLLLQFLIILIFDDMKVLNFSDDDKYMIVLSSGAILMTAADLHQVYGESNFNEIEQSLTVIGDCCQVDLGEGMTNKTGEYIENIAVIVKIK